jgi:hypothetical protein
MSVAPGSPTAGSAPPPAAEVSRRDDADVGGGSDAVADVPVADDPAEGGAGGFRMVAAA